MKFKKLTICVLMLLLSMFVLTACKDDSKEDAENNTGEETVAVDETKEYMEIAVDESLKDLNIMVLRNNAKGEAVAYYEDEANEEKGYLRFNSEGAVEENFKVDFEGEGSIFAFDKDNNMYVMVIDLGPIEALKVDAKYQLKKGTFGNTEFEDMDFTHSVEGLLEEVQEDMIAKMMFDSEGNMLILKGNGAIEKYDSKFSIEEILDDKKVSDFVIDKNDMIFCLSALEDASVPTTLVSKMDPATQEIVEEKQFEDKLWIVSINYDQKTDRIYMLSEGTIFSYDTELEHEVVALDMNELSQFQFTFGFAPITDDNFYAMVYVKDGMEIVFYGDADEETLKAREETVDKKTITLQVMLDFNGIYKKAATAFKKVHPEIEVEIVEFGKIEAEEYTEKLNLKMMAGEGADMFMDNFPEATYAEKGYLLELDDIIANDSSFALADYNENVLEASKIGGSLYAFPVRYYYYINIINKKLMDELGIEADKDWNIEDFKNAMEAIKGADDKYKMFDKNFAGDTLATFLINFDEFIDYSKRTADFDNDRFKAILELTKELKEGDYINENINMYELFQGGGDGRENILVFPFYLAAYAVNAPFEVFEDSFEVWKAPGHEGVKMGSMKLAINSSTEYPEECWEFIKFLISTEGQEITELQGFSINDAYRVTMVDVYNKRIEQIKSTFPDARSITEEEVAVIEALDGNIGGRLMMEDSLYKAIKEEMNAYFDGEKGLDEAAETIQNKVTIYLNE